MADATRDEAAVASLRSGDDQAYADVVASWSPALMRTALALTGDRGTAEQLVRSVWLAIPREIDRFHPPPGFRAWLLGRLIERAGVAVDATPVEGDLVDPDRFLPPEHPQWPGHWKTPPTAWPAMDDVRPARGVGTALRSALGRLAPGERVVVGLRDVGGCEVGDISLLLGQPPERVRSLLNRGRAELRTELELHFGAPSPA